MPAGAASRTSLGTSGVAGGAGGANGIGVRTSGGLPRPLLLLGWAFAAATIAVNALSDMADRARAGLPADATRIWTLEISSGLAVMVLMPAVMWAAARWRPPAQSTPGALLRHVAAALLFSALHILLMVALRNIALALLGDPYRFDWSRANLLYELRKDAITYALVAAVTLLWLRARPGPGATATIPAPSGPAVLVEVRDRGRLRRLGATDLAFVSAAGNYVELGLADGGRLLHRETLAAMEARLGSHGFVRVHRSHLVREDLVVEVVPTGSGDATLRLRSGECVPASRRFRKAWGSGGSGASATPG